jgi:hypothetical protein
MEFTRFGGNITSLYWGCCACCIIQDFNQSPKDPASIQLVDGDGCSAILNQKGEQLYAGPTYGDIFKQRLRFGTFSDRDMPNHAFLAIITESQLSCGYGKQWLEILKETGFEFIRTINNSVYTGQKLLGEPVESNCECDYDDGCCCDEYDPEDTSEIHGDSANYLFGLFRNIGRGAALNPYQPPEAWTNIGGGKPIISPTETDGLELTVRQQEFDFSVWNNLPKQDTLLTEAELRSKNVPVWLSGKRVQEARPKLKPKDAPASKEVSLTGAKKAAPDKAYATVSELAAVFKMPPPYPAPTAKVFKK